ncbi:MAG: glycosyltransferase family 39 protein [Nanoarchaeota archaeon]|nr:glycosyltransferase family 39 protein [Nanoarchaeota archaeon]
MNAKKWLISIFLLTLAIRLYFAFSIPNFTYESYFHLRQVEHIATTFTPLFQDSLSYGGRELIFLPFFHYLFAFFSYIFPLAFIAKVLPNIFLASLTIVVYLLAQTITKDKKASLLSALVAGFLPVLFFTNSFTPMTLFLPLAFFTIYLFLNAKRKKHLKYYLACFLILSITSSATFLLIIGFVIYLLLSVIERNKIPKTEIELILFSLFFYMWIQFLFYKRVLIDEGISFIWQNIPSGLIAQYFPTISVTQAILLVSVIPFIAGIYVVYNSLFELKIQKAFLLISFVISTSILAWLKFIQYEFSLSFVGIILAVLFALFYEESITYFKKTKFSNFGKYYIHLLIILLILTTLFPAITAAKMQEIPSNEELAAFQWLNQNIPQSAVVAATVEEGHIISYISERGNVIDDRFHLIDDIDERYKGNIAMFRGQFETEVLDYTEKYGIDYLIISEHAKDKYNIGSRPPYLSNKCFKRIYDNQTRIYLIRCKVQ